MVSEVRYGIAIVRDSTEKKQLIDTLRSSEKELDEKTRYLEKVNQALKASLDHREIEIRSVEENLLAKIKQFIFPYLGELGRCEIDADAKAYLKIVETNLSDLISKHSRTIFSKYADFTPTEVRIADCIREGRDTKAIARLMGMAPSSVQWHRKNIRTKLGLVNKKSNLYSHLNSYPK
jgi:DNA-binding CsgD family transcriptional regulator